MSGSNAPSQLSSQSDLRRLGTILSIWAHPDDETFCCGGLLAGAAENGQRVVCVTATYGEAGSQDPVKWPPETLGEVRRQELTAALEILGIDEHHWLGYPDGGCTDVDQNQAVGRLAELIEQIKPDTIFTFGREGLTGHPDHQAVCRWSHDAIAQAGAGIDVYHPVIDEEHYQSHFKPADAKLNIFYAIDQPPVSPARHCSIGLRLPAALLKKKQDALSVMTSQTAAMLAAFDEDFLTETWSVECLNRCSG